MRIAFYILMMFLILVSAVDSISGGVRKSEESKSSVMNTLGIKQRKIDSLIVFGISTVVTAVMLTVEVIL